MSFARWGLVAGTAAAESASAEAESRIADARASIDASLSGVAGIVVVSDEDVAEAEQAVADAEQSVAEAQAAADQAQSEVEQARAERDLARAEAEQARAEAAKAELCADASLAATQALSENDDTAVRRTRRLPLAPRRLRVPARNGNVVLQGWTGMWIGLIRTEVGGNVNFSKNTAMDPSVVPGSDSSEVQTNVIAGNLICHGNTPTAQVNQFDGGEPNEIGGNAVGECPPRIVDNPTE